MIVRPRPGSLQLLFVLRDTILPGVLPHVMDVAALSCLVVWGFGRAGSQLPHAKHRKDRRTVKRWRTGYWIGGTEEGR
jgi:hypothetical protein